MNPENTNPEEDKDSIFYTGDDEQTVEGGSDSFADEESLIISESTNIPEPLNDTYRAYEHYADGEILSLWPNDESLQKGYPKRLFPGMPVKLKEPVSDDFKLIFEGKTDVRGIVKKISLPGKAKDPRACLEVGFSIFNAAPEQTVSYWVRPDELKYLKR